MAISIHAPRAGSDLLFECIIPREDVYKRQVVKIPMTVEGLKACKVLTAEGIKTNVTLIFTANQALLALSLIHI